MKADPGEYILVLATLLAAAAALTVPSRFRPWAAAAVLIFGPASVAADNWHTARFEDLRDEPLLLISAVVALAVAVALMALAFRRFSLLFPLAAVAVLALRVPIELGGETSHLLVPLYLVIAGGLIARAPDLAALRIEGYWLWTMRSLAAVLAIYGIQAAYGPGFSQAAENAGFFFGAFAVLLLLLASVEWNRRLLKLALYVVAAEALIFTAVAAGQYASGELWWNRKVIEGNEYHEWFRVNSLFWDPNIFGRYLAVAVSLLAALVAHAPTARNAWLATAAATAMIAGLAASFSQSALLSLIAGLVLIVALRWGVRRTALAIAACLTIAVTALAISGLPDLSEERAEEETSGRVGLIRGGLELAEAKLVFGHGSGAFAPAYKKRFDTGRGVAVSSHSEPVTVAAEQGAVGVIAYLALLVAACLAFGHGLVSRRNEPRLRWVRIARVAAFAAFAVMVVNSIAYAAFLTDPITWALLGIGLALAGYEGRNHLSDV